MPRLPFKLQWQLMYARCSKRLPRTIRPSLQQNFKFCTSLEESCLCSTVDLPDLDKRAIFARKILKCVFLLVGQSVKQMKTPTIQQNIVNLSWLFGTYIYNI